MDEISSSLNENTSSGIGDGGGKGEQLSEKEFKDSRMSNAPFEKIQFFEGGAADVTFSEDHGFDYFAVTHEARELPDDAYGRWECPEFSGPKTIDLKSAIASQDNYPSRKFIMDVVAPEGGYLVTVNTTVGFEVPESYMPG